MTSHRTPDPHDDAIPEIPENPDATALDDLRLFAGDDAAAAPTMAAPESTGPAEVTEARGLRGAWNRANARFPRLVTPVVASVAAFVLVVGVGASVAATAHKTVEVDVNGELVAVSTFAGSVEGLLAQQGIELGEHDLVEPGVDAALASGDEIVVRHAQQVEVVIDGEEQTVWTTALDAGEAVADLSGSGRDVMMVASRSGARAALDLPLVIDGRVVIAVDGDVHEVLVRGQATVHEVLEQAEIELGSRDTLEVGAREDGTPLVTIARIDASQRVETEPIAYTSREVTSDDYYEGTRRVTTEGADGILERRYRITTVDGSEVAEELIVEYVAQRPVEEVITVGTAPRPVTPAPSPAPAPAPAPAPGGDDGGGDGGGAVPAGDVWAALAQCESGGNPTTNTGNGYYGLYQFSLPTWQSVGGSGLPSEASAEEQTQRAQILQARSGWGQWPACARKLGLL